MPLLAADSLILVSLYEEMNGEFWNQSTWFAGDLASTWEGVGTKGNRITFLDLDLLSAFGDLPEEIIELDSLEYLDIAGTGTNTLNADLRNLNNLYYLDVSFNSLTFDDLTPFVDFVTDTTKTILYGSQGTITNDELIVLETATTITQSVPAFNGASYRWFNDDIELTGTSNTITFDLATDNRVNLRADATHPDFPDLVLSSGIFRGRVNYFNTEFESQDPYFSFDPSDSVQHRYRNSVAHDFDGDGYDDLIILKNSNEVSYYSGSPDGLELQEISDFEVSNRFYQDIHLGDFNGDGTQDVIINVYDSLDNLRQFALFVFDGSQPFGADPASILLLGSEGLYNGDFPLPGNSIGDVDGDGSDEFFFATILDDAKGYLVNISTDFTISYSEATSLDYSFGCRIQGLGDISGDGIDDFAVSTFQDDIVLVFRGNTSGNFSIADFSMPFDANHIRSGNFNGDEFSDLAVTYSNVPDFESDKLVSIYYGGTAFDLIADASFNVTSQPMNGAFELELNGGPLEFDVIEDPTEEGLDDFVFFTSFGSNGVMVEMENAEESLIPSLRYNSVFERPLGRANNFVNTYRRPVSGDFNSDGIPDIVVPEADTTVHIYSAYINEAPVVKGGSFSVAENPENGMLIGNVEVSDINENIDNESFAIISGNTDSTFDLVGNEIYVSDSSLIDFEANQTFELTISASDKGGLQSTGQILIEITDVNETPEVLDASFEINELLEVETEVGSVEFSDPEEDELTISITEGNSDDAFSIDQDGVITVNNADAIDIDDNPSFELVISVSDGEFVATGSVSLVLLNVNETPVVEDATFEIDGFPEESDEVGTLVFADPDNDILTFEIVGGNDNEAFAINDAGLISVNNLEAFVSNDPFELTVEVSDQEFSVMATVTILMSNILGLNEHSLKVYPNPTEGDFTVENQMIEGRIVSINITDLSGREVSFSTERLPSGGFRVKMKTKSKGLFIVHVETKDNIIIRKVTKI